MITSYPHYGCLPTGRPSQSGLRLVLGAAYVVSLRELGSSESLLKNL